MWETPWTFLYEIEIPFGVLSWKNCSLKSAEKAASCQLQSDESPLLICYHQSQLVDGDKHAGANYNFALFQIFVYWSLTKPEVCRIAFEFVVQQEWAFFCYQDFYFL